MVGQALSPRSRNTATDPHDPQRHEPEAAQTLIALAQVVMSDYGCGT